ncbi:MlaA family lipoprotein [Alysiella filiformis]|uniref:Phospholipid-binding lipoprotein MlaA n=1 Tax=Alysiella filiformis DSM 16848 TaxID=1120981 RepID=A0A286EBV5_9NEIS|nr:VacJ family lipoprotein [Alysiella filiformis]QMT31336.1 VacJ family lipoprotein [Alysiella filiformis]UBQ55658.1 VacJ family lipoprotein [Alysiella filiformis DSM 16848]SOD68383.1 phospholipid-binding lipoprotein MlaA [Alysiella filiformis DSM 16848]
MKRHTQIILALAAIGLVNPALAERNPHDPYERYNRAMYRFNDKADRHVFQPVARTYRKITPQPVRTATRNFMNNLRDVVSFGSNMLRGDLEKAGTDFMRVSLNSTFGLGGLINWADAAGMPDNKNHLGDTFATWGWKNSHYFVYPFTGPSTVRDSLGSTITTVASPNKFIIHDTAARYSVSALNAVDTRANLLDATDSINDAALDKYAYTRDIYLAYRNKQVGNTQAQAEENIDDLFNETDEQATQQQQQPENTSPPKPNTQPENDPVLQLNMDIAPLPISTEAQQATQEYINLWQNQAQNNTAFY